MNFVEFLTRRRSFRWNRGLRPGKRSTALQSMDQSLASIAYALKIIVLKEYKLDIDQMPSRGDLEREVFEPIFADNAREAIVEERDRLAAIEREMRAGSGVRVRATADDRGGVRLTPAHRPNEDEDLSPEERAFLHELEKDENGESDK